MFNIAANLTSNISTSRSIRKCIECDEEKSSNITICNICGSSITVITETSHAPQTEQTVDAIRANFREIFGDDIVAMFDEAMGHTAPSRKVSLDYFAKLSKVTVDHHKCILLDSFLEINNLRILTTCASFHIPEVSTQCSGEVVWSNPEYGDTPLLGDYHDKIVIMKRGKVSFIHKALEAQRVGAKAVVSIQNTDKWPFIMTDSSNEHLSLGNITIPVMMISVEDGALIENMILAMSKSSSSIASAHSKVLMASLYVDCLNTECIVCREDYVDTDVVIKLPCRHLYHHDCLKAWLERNNTCPMCRHAMPTSSST